VFAIVLFLTLASIFIVLLMLMLVVFIFTIILLLCYFIAIDCWTFGFFSYKQEGNCHPSSYLEELKGEALEPLIRIPASLTILS